MTTWNCFIPCEPTAKQRARVTRKGIAYTPIKTRKNEAFLKYFLLQNKPPRFDGPVSVTVVFHLLKPKSAKKRIYPAVKPDIDNYTKLIFDACNGLVFNDDAQVIRLSAEKKYADEEGIYISVEAL